MDHKNAAVVVAALHLEGSGPESAAELALPQTPKLVLKSLLRRRNYRENGLNGKRKVGKGEKW